MKKRLLLLFSLLLLISCEDKTIDITVLPAETTHGAHTFGCLIDGWVYVGGRYSSIDFYLKEDGNMMVCAYVKPQKTISFTILHPQEGATTTITDVRWNGEKLPDGTASITHLDTREKIISGRFSGGSITEGRFDVCYATFRPVHYTALQP
jgi:hypothetical protein